MIRQFGLIACVVGVALTVGVASCGKKDDKATKSKDGVAGDKKPDGDKKTNGDKKPDGAKKPDGDTKPSDKNGDKTNAPSGTAKPFSDAEASATIKRFVDELCACKDSACVKAVHKRSDEWTKTTIMAMADDKDAMKRWVALRPKHKADQERGFECSLKLTQTPRVAEATAVITTTVNGVCACKDAECAETFVKKMQKWMNDKMSAIKVDSEKSQWVNQLKYDYKPEFTRVRGCTKKFNAGGNQAEKMDAFANQMCACKDLACAKTVQTTMMAWVKVAFKGRKKKGSRQNVMKWKHHQQRYLTCYRKLMTPKAK